MTEHRPRSPGQREPITTLDEVRAPYNVVAAVKDLRSARRMIEALEAAGVEASHISLLGARKAGHLDEVAPEAFDEPEGKTAAAWAEGGWPGRRWAGSPGP